MFLEALFVIARNWKQPKWPLMKECIKKMWHIYTLAYSAVKKQWHLEFCMQNEETRKYILSEIMQTQKDKYGMYSPKSGYYL